MITWATQLPPSFLKQRVSNGVVRNTWLAHQGVPGASNPMMPYHLTDPLQDFQNKLSTVFSLYAKIWVGQQTIPAQNVLDALDQLAQALGKIKTARAMLIVIQQLETYARQTSLNTALAASLQDLGVDALQGLIPLLPNQTDAQQSKYATLQEYLKVINGFTANRNYSLQDIAEVLGQAAEELLK